MNNFAEDFFFVVICFIMCFGLLALGMAMGSGVERNHIQNKMDFCSKIDDQSFQSCLYYELDKRGGNEDNQ